MVVSVRKQPTSYTPTAGPAQPWWECTLTALGFAVTGSDWRLGQCLHPRKELGRRECGLTGSMVACSGRVGYIALMLMMWESIVNFLKRNHELSRMIGNCQGWSGSLTRMWLALALVCIWASFQAISRSTLIYTHLYGYLCTIVISSFVIYHI